MENTEYQETTSPSLEQEVNPELTLLVQELIERCSRKGRNTATSSVTETGNMTTSQNVKQTMLEMLIHLTTKCDYCWGDHKIDSCQILKEREPENKASKNEIPMGHAIILCQCCDGADHTIYFCYHYQKWLNEIKKAIAAKVNVTLLLPFDLRPFEVDESTPGFNNPCKEGWQLRVPIMLSQRQHCTTRLVYHGRKRIRAYDPRGNFFEYIAAAGFYNDQPEEEMVELISDDNVIRSGYIRCYHQNRAYPRKSAEIRRKPIKTPYNVEILGDEWSQHEIDTGRSKENLQPQIQIDSDVGSNDGQVMKKQETESLGESSENFREAAVPYLGDENKLLTEIPLPDFNQEVETTETQPTQTVDTMEIVDTTQVEEKTTHCEEKDTMESQQMVTESPTQTDPQVKQNRIWLRRKGDVKGLQVTIPNITVPEVQENISDSENQLKLMEGLRNVHVGQGQDSGYTGEEDLEASDDNLELPDSLKPIPITTEEMALTNMGESDYNPLKEKFIYKTGLTPTETELNFPKRATAINYCQQVLERMYESSCMRQARRHQYIEAGIKYPSDLGMKRDPMSNFTLFIHQARDGKGKPHSKKVCVTIKRGNWRNSGRVVDSTKGYAIYDYIVQRKMVQIPTRK